MLPRKYILLIQGLLICLISTGCVSVETNPTEIMQTTEEAQALPTNTMTTTPEPASTELVGYDLPEVKYENLLSTAYTNGGCELPCFWGVVTGETTWDYASIVLGVIHEFDETVFFYDDSPLIAHSIPIQYRDTKGRVINASLSLSKDERYVQRINLYAEADTSSDMYFYWGYYSIENVFSQLGPPDRISIDIYSNDIENYPGYNILIEYQEIGLLYWIAGDRIKPNTICPQINEIGQVDYFRMSITNPNIPVDLFPPDWEFWSLGNEEELIPPEDVFGITSDDFYQTILSDPSACFDVIE